MKKILSTRVLVKIGVLTTILLVLIIYTIWGNSALMVSTVNISSDRIPSAFSNFQIAQVSDLHNAEFGESNTDLIELLSEHEPDIIVITGDLIDAGQTDIEIAFDFVKKAVQIAPVYFVTGNHEANFSHYDQFKTGLETSGVIVLEDEAIQLVHNNEMITLIGLSDPDFTIKGDMFNEVPAMVNTKLNSLIDDENSYTILLSHRPELFETYVCCGVDLVLCGHAHGGQFRLPFIGGLVAPNQGLFPKYDSGLYADGKTNMVVSRGLGNSIIPFRFNNRPDVVLVELNERKLSDIRANIEMLEQQMEDEVSLKRRVEDFKKALSQNEVLQEFDRGIFESIIEKVIVGGYDEDGKKDPYKITFIYKTGFRNEVGNAKQRFDKTKSVGDKAKELCSHIADEVKDVCSYVSDNTCGDGCQIIPQKRYT